MGDPPCTLVSDMDEMMNTGTLVLVVVDNEKMAASKSFIVQELCERRGGRPGLSVLTSLMVSMDVKQC